MRLPLPLHFCFLMVSAAAFTPATFAEQVSAADDAIPLRRGPTTARQLAFNAASNRYVQGLLGLEEEIELLVVRMRDLEKQISVYETFPDSAFLVTLQRARLERLAVSQRLRRLQRERVAWQVQAGANYGLRLGNPPR